MERKLKENSKQVDEIIREGSKNVNDRLNEIKGELGNELRRVEETMTQIKTRIESQLDQVQVELNERIEIRLRENQAEMSGQFTTQLSVVAGRMDEINERVNTVQNMATNNEREYQTRVRDLEKEIEVLQNKVTATIDHVGSERANISSITSEPGTSGYMGNHENGTPVV